MKEYPLGSLLNTEDNRDIALSTVATALGIDTSSHPKKNITDISMLAVEDQKQNGSCVGQAEGKDAEFQNFIETGKVTRLSKRALYAMCKAQDGNTGEGTYPRVAAKIRVETGVPKESLVKDDNSLPHADFIKVEITKDIKTDASEYRSKGYSFIYTLDELKTAIDVTKAFNATLFVGDWSELPVKPLKEDGSNRGTHRIWIFGYEDAKNGKLDDTKVYYLNSWGINWAKGRSSADRKLLKQGVGYFWWSEYVGYLRDAIVYLDMPNEIIDYAKAQQYIFPRQLERGMTGTDVTELQKRLDTEIAFDGKKCYVANYYDVHFGALTEASVQRYQKTKGIVSSGTPTTTGYGRVGAKTLASLNGTPVPEVKSLYPIVERMKNQLVAIMKSIGQPIMVTSTYRSIAEQDALYAQGRTKPGAIVTNAKGGQSMHNWQVAFDIAFLDKGGAIHYNGDWSLVSAIGKTLGLAWGGDWSSFPDKPHFEYSAGYTLADFQNGKIDESKFADYLITK